MLRYITRRLLWLPLLLIIISAITFILGVYSPIALSSRCPVYR